MTFDRTITDAMDQAVPLLKEFGFKTITYQPGTTAVEVHTSPLKENHVGTFHAGVLFTLGEYTSGSCVMGTMLDVADRVVVVVKDGHIDFVAPAKGRAVATANIPLDVLQQARESVLKGEKVDLSVNVEIVSAGSKDSGSDHSGQIAANCTYTWALRPVKK